MSDKLISGKDDITGRDVIPSKDFLPEHKWKPQHGAVEDWEPPTGGLFQGDSKPTKRQRNELEPEDNGLMVINFDPKTMSDPENMLDFLWYIDDSLRQVSEVADVLKIKDQLDAVQFLRDKLGFDESIKTRATESQIRTNRRLGELLLAMPKNKGVAIDGNPGAGTRLHDATALTYEEMGIEKTAAHRAQTLAKVPEEKIEAFITAASESGHEITMGGVVKYATNVVRKQEREARGEIPFPPGKYRVIVADPPWEYDNSGFVQSAESKYPTMPTKDICNLPIADLYDDEAVLFLWATSPLLPDALEVMKAWGFEYKASMVWEKNAAPGIGWFVQTYHEFLLIGVKGTGMHPDYQPKSTFTGSVTEHSKKPDGPFDTIERMYKGPYIELFARRAREGWEVWGNEV